MILKQFVSPNGSTVTIRKAREEDAADIIQLARFTLESFPQFVLTTPEEFTPSIEEEKEWIRKHNRPDGFLALALVSNKMIGLVHVLPCEKKRMSHSGELAIALHPEYTDQKIGTELMHCLIDWARKNNNMKKLVLNVSAQNPRAIHLYQKLGFVKEGINKMAVQQKDGSYSDNIQMVLFTM